MGRYLFVIIATTMLCISSSANGLSEEQRDPSAVKAREHIASIMRSIHELEAEFLLLSDASRTCVDVRQRELSRAILALVRRWELLLPRARYSPEEIEGDRVLIELTRGMHQKVVDGGDPFEHTKLARGCHKAAAFPYVRTCYLVLFKNAVVSFIRGRAYRSFRPPCSPGSPSDDS